MQTMKLTIAGKGEGDDAPLVEDLIGQLGDFLGLLREVEDAVAEPGEENEIVWRVTGATRNSPLSIEITAFPKRHGMNIDQRERKVRAAAAHGLAEIKRAPARPDWFDDRALTKAGGIFGRVSNGLAATTIDFGNDLPPVVITSETARAAAANIVRIQKPVDRPYRELGSVEGYFEGFERDGFGRLVLRLRARLTNETAKCILQGQAAAAFEERSVGEVIERGRRLVVSGTLHHRGPGRLYQVDADRLQLLRNSGLPDVADITDPGFTGGLRSEDFLAGMRDAGSA
ncbi:hypothetical protein [Roseomonas sp. BN140053]|uniref:hypothetical protein n=1 Tax=Roseomonas sp. BN140053 TaxID=3391898 RepID=UPI0039EAE9EE